MLAHLLRRPLLRLLPLVYLDNDGTVNTLAAASRSLRGIVATSVKGDGDSPSRNCHRRLPLRIFPSPTCSFDFRFFSLSLSLSFFSFLLCTLSTVYFQLRRHSRRGRTSRSSISDDDYQSRAQDPFSNILIRSPALSSRVFRYTCQLTTGKKPVRRLGLSRL